MLIKYSVLGMFIYAGMAAFLAAFAARLAGRRALHGVFFAGGFALAAAGVVVRWFEAGHVPLGNLFEVFLCLAMLMYPLRAFCRRFLGTPGEGFDAALALLLLVPPGFFLSAEPQKLPPALQHWLFTPHVAAYMLSYVILFKAAGAAALRLLAGGGADGEGKVEAELATYRMVRLGFPLLTLGLVLGSWWGKIAWGDWWNWDPKELWSLATWLVFAGYLHFRHARGARHPRVNCAIVLLGGAAIVITLLWVNLAGRLFGGLHSYGV